MLQYYLIITLLTFTFSVSCQNRNEELPSVILPPNNLRDAVTQTFNNCKCVIHYLCDEENFIIPKDQLTNTKVSVNIHLKSIRRLRCSNDFYYCCQNATSSAQTSKPVLASTFSTALVTESDQSHRTKCGQSSLYSTSLKDTFPWIVAVLHKNRNNSFRFRCGGTLIHPRVVLTANHCVLSSKPEDIQIGSRIEHLRHVRISKIIKNENYYSGGLFNDIALIILDYAATKITPVCLPEMANNFNGQQCVAVAWGRSYSGARRLRKINLPVVDSRSCQNQLRNTRLGDYFTLHPSFICAGGRGENTRRGEGGSPLMCKQGNSYVQVGITSWGVEDTDMDIPGLYANVIHLKSWIDQKLSQANLRI